MDERSPLRKPAYQPLDEAETIGRVGGLKPEQIPGFAVILSSIRLDERTHMLADAERAMVEEHVPEEMIKRVIARLRDA